MQTTDGARPPEPTQDTASFLRRLAGPSVTKAGLAKDQTEINRIIAEASKGSKFYDNEKRKDKELTERISKILKIKDEILKEADVAKAEHSADTLIAKMEAERDLTQIIVHVDMDAFYANVELLDDPTLLDKPYAVGNGVICTASYAARKHGVRSGMAEFIARKLYPELIVVPLHFPRYMALSKQVMDIFRRYDPTMCAAGCDEGYLNITRYCEEHLMTADECVQEMRATVHRETKLTVSAGIAPNKMLAKICSDKNKPNGQFMLEFSPSAVKAFMHDLSIRKIPGVGRVNERLLESIDVKTCGDIYTHRATIALMDKYFGMHFLLQTYLGIASNVVEPGQREERKSIGAERTFHAIGDRELILKKLDEVAEELSGDMESSGWTGKTVTLKYKLDTYQVFTRAKSFDRWISTRKEDLFATGKELLLPELPLRLRLIGLRVTKLKDLRDDADSKPGSIKRFFEKANAPASPQKKRKVSFDHHPEDTEDLDEPQLSQDGFEEAMPGYYESEEVEQDFNAADPEDIALQDQTVASGTARTSRPPASATTASVAGNSARTESGKPRSGINPSRANSHPPPFVSRSTLSPEKRKRSRCGEREDGPAMDIEDTQNHTCPICSKTLQTNNRGLNEHVDFCLSKSAIREAQVMSNNVKSLKQPLPVSVSGKPGFKTKKARK